MPRFYVPNTVYTLNEKISLPAEAVHHAMHVLRLREGEDVEIFDGKGGSAIGKISFGPEKAEVLIQAIRAVKELPVEIVILQALVVNDKMDLIVEKACEIGTQELYIYPPERTDLKPAADKLQKRLERWQRISIAACSQCGRSRLLKIEYCPTFHAALEKAKGLKLLLDPSADSNVVLPNEVKAVSFLIGPEGGFTPKEIASATQKGFEAMKLGNLILRTETAAIVAAAYAQTLWGSFQPDAI